MAPEPAPPGVAGTSSSPFDTREFARKLRPLHRPTAGKLSLVAEECALRARQGHAAEVVAGLGRAWAKGPTLRAGMIHAFEFVVIKQPSFRGLIGKKLAAWFADISKGDAGEASSAAKVDDDTRRARKALKRWKERDIFDRTDVEEAERALAEKSAYAGQEGAAAAAAPPEEAGSPSYPPRGLPNAHGGDNDDMYGEVALDYGEESPGPPPNKDSAAGAYDPFAVATAAAPASARSSGHHQADAGPSPRARSRSRSPPRRGPPPGQGGRRDDHRAPTRHDRPPPHFGGRGHPPPRWDDRGGPPQSWDDRGHRGYGRPPPMQQPWNGGRHPPPRQQSWHRRGPPPHPRDANFTRRRFVPSAQRINNSDAGPPPGMEKAHSKPAHSTEPAPPEAAPPKRVSPEPLPPGV